MSASRLQGKVAIVTGAATGIGKAIARKFGREGASVAVNYLTDPQAAQEVVDDILANGGSAFPVQADISKIDQLAAMFSKTLDHYGRLDILVNNAATTLNKPVAEVSEAEFDLIYAINVKGTFFACQLACHHMVEGGRIINLSSATTGLMLPGYGTYDSTKGAVEQLTRILSKELGPKNITVNAVSPGATETEQFRRGKSDDLIASFIRLSSFGRLGQVDDIADVVTFLATDEARWVTGQNIRVNGGTC
jgi:3-oxoacyl-[acyl-carrier protein] reductase